MMSDLSKLAKRVVLRGGSPYYFARKWIEIASTPGSFVRRRRMGGVLTSEATEDDRRVVNDIRQRGFHVLDQPLALTDELLAECRHRLAAYKASAGPARPGEVDLDTKFFWADLLKDQQPSPESIFIRYASQDRLVRMAALYLGAAPYLSNVSVQYSMESARAPTHSQLWHRDYDDVKLFKVFVYCSDVSGDDDGAFHVADRRSVKGIYATPLYSTRRYNDAQFFGMADRSMTTSIVGPAGTTFICDTRHAFHYGSRCVRPRLACWFTYQSYAGLYPALHVTDPRPDSPAATRMLLSPHA
jgi:hypothetical protein